jgi:serine/threonine-protein kinase
LSRVTRYEMLDRIGVGGMAEIFRGKAVAAGGFEKPVAIKRILPHLSQDKRFVELLIAEAKVLSLLKHRNIVQIFDVGLGDDGQYFLVMELVDGKDLGAVQRAIESRRQRIPFDLALHIGAEVCEALEHAHSARAPDGKPMSLVHRDVSPSNVLLSRAGEIKLTDFGIAKRAESEQTEHGAVRGKFAYISPEQARNERLDPRSDVFAVAVLVWELVTGKRLFSGLGDLEALRAVRAAQVRRPTEADPRLDAAVDDLLMPALSKDPKRRPTAAQLGEQLRSLPYSLDATIGDPATELAKIIDNADAVANAGVLDDQTSATVIRIQTADAFAGGADVAKARQVSDRFGEEETRRARLSSHQLRQLRGEPVDRDSDPGTSLDPGDDADEHTRPIALTDLQRLASSRARAATHTPAPWTRDATMRTPSGTPDAPMYLEPSGAAPMPQPPFASTTPHAPTHLEPSGAAPMPQPEQFLPPAPPAPAQLPPLPWAGPPHVPMYPHPRPRASMQLWMLAIGVLVMALIAFAVTRALIH